LFSSTLRTAYRSKNPGHIDNPEEGPIATSRNGCEEDVVNYGLTVDNEPRALSKVGEDDGGINNQRESDLERQ
jgi:hypothetical protein